MDSPWQACEYGTRDRGEHGEKGEGQDVAKVPVEAERPRPRTPLERRLERSSMARYGMLSGYAVAA